MGKLLYYDGAIAVSDFAGDNASVDSAIQLLLALDTNSPISEEHLKTLLECWAIPIGDTLILPPLTNEKHQHLLRNADKDALSAVGYVFTDRVPFPHVSWPEDAPLRCLIDVAAIKKHILRLAESLQYLGKLYLLSTGDARSADILPDIELGENALLFCAPLPTYLATPITRFDLATQAHFNKAKSEELPFDSSHQTMSVSVDYATTGKLAPRDKFWDMLPEHMRLPKGGLELKQIAASYLLSSLLCYQTPLPYETRYETHDLAKNGNTSLANEMAKLMIDGKIRACPHCGRPILVKRDKGMMYCSASCRTLYNRKAKKMCSGGATVDEVHESFPAIPKQTIRGWLPMEGR